MFTRPHRRLNPLTGEWVLVSPQRTERPWQGQVEKRPSEHRPRYDPDCYLCPGNAARRRRAQLPPTLARSCSTTTSPRCCPTRRRRHVRARDGLLRRRERARHLPGGLLLAAPRPDARPDDRRGDPAGSWIPGPSSTPSSARSAGRLRADLREPRRDDGRQQPAPARPDLGRPSGCRTSRRKELRQQREYFAAGGCLLCDYLALELRRGRARRRAQNEHFVALVPFWAVWPFETLVLPRQHHGALPIAGPGRSATAWPTSCAADPPLRQAVRGVVPVLDGLPPAADRRRGPPRVAPARALLPAAAALGDACASSWSATSCWPAAARHHPGERGRAAARRTRPTLTGQGRAVPDCPEWRISRRGRAGAGCGRARPGAGSPG